MAGYRYARGWKSLRKKGAHKPSDAEIDFTDDYSSIDRDDDVINSETRRGRA